MFLRKSMKEWWEIVRGGDLVRKKLTWVLVNNWKKERGENKVRIVIERYKAVGEREWRNYNK